jgi:hypothetical protein
MITKIQQWGSCRLHALPASTIGSELEPLRRQVPDNNSLGEEPKLVVDCCRASLSATICCC